MRKTALPLAALVFVALLGACESTSDSTTTTAPTEAESTSTTAATTTTAAPTTSSSTTTTTLPVIDWVFVPDTDQPVVTLLDDGDEPRQVMEYALEPGVTNTYVLRQAITLSQEIDGVEITAFTTDVAVEVTNEVISVDDAGATIAQTFGGVQVLAAEASMRPTLEGVYAALEGLTSHVLIARNGAIVATSTSDLPPDLAPFAEQGAAAAAAFPLEPIGVGAQWQIDNITAVQGITFLQTSIAELTAFDGTVATVELTLSQDLGPDGISFPGIETTEVAFDAFGEGAATWNLLLPPPSSGTTAYTQELVATLTLGDETATLDQVTQMSMEITDGPLVDLDPVIEGQALPIMPSDVAIDDSASGSVIPAVTGFDFGQSEVTIDPTDGRAKAIVFLAHWCSHCQNEVPRVQEWLDTTGGDPDVDLYSVATSNSPTRPNYPASTWLEGEGWTTPVILDDIDSSVLRAYGAGGFPYWVFVNSDGTVALRTAGELQIPQLETILDALD